MDLSKLVDRKIRPYEKEADGLVDSLGLHVDKKIRLFVATLRALGFNITGSCEGHPKGKHGCPYPWVDFHGRKDQHRLHKLLWAFYRLSQANNYPYMLICISTSIPKFANFRLQPVDAELARKGNMTAHRRYLNEVDSFRMFLRGSIRS